MVITTTNYTVLTLLGGLLLTVIFLKRRYQYWTSKGVYQIEPTWLLGNVGPVIIGQDSMGGIFTRWYEQIRKNGLKYGGIYMFTRPVFIATDPNLVKQILTADFPSFYSHDMYCNEKADPLSGHLFNLEGAKWKTMRAKLTSIFTSGKMKMMFNTMKACSFGLDEMLGGYSRSGGCVDIKDIIGRFTTDVIGNCGFGIDCNSIKNPNNEFRIYGKKVFEVTKLLMVRVILLGVIPLWVSTLLGLKVLAEDVNTFFFDLVAKTVKYREENNVVRKDFMHLLLQVKNKGRVTDDNDFRAQGESKMAITVNEITAQTFAFFAAGFETSATTMTFALYELAMNEDIQEKLRKEINETIGKYGGDVTYDAVIEMKYLDRVINETLRMHSPVTTLIRRCTKDYKIPDTNTVIEKGTAVQIPVLGIHLDAEYYPDPELFDPERFTDENKAKRPSCTFLPFGEGPRICIGLRFGVLQSKIGLIAILRNCKLTLNEKTKLPLEMDPSSGINSVKSEVWVNVMKLQR